MSAPVTEGEVLAGKYRVERVLGEGGMGVVVAAMHIQLEQRVALKFLLPHALQNSEAVGRFLREARAAVKLKGEHVAKVSDVGTLENGSPYMVMEYLEGSDLSDVLHARGRFEVEAAVDFLLQAAEAVAEAHQNGIVHRDLKPANFFITKRHDGTAMLKVLDFGISKMAGGLDGGMTKTTAVMGSPFYMSPEQMRSSRNVDGRSDLWALGIILFELLTGGVAFNADTMPELCANVLTNPTPSIRSTRPELPQGIEDVINRCLQKDPTLRYQNVAELARDLAPFASDQARTNLDRIMRMQGGALIAPRPTLTSLGDVPRSQVDKGAATITASTADSFGASTPGAPRGKGALFAAIGAVAVVAVVGVVLLTRTGSKPDAGKDPGAGAPPPPASTPAAATTSTPVVTPAPPTPATSAPPADPPPVPGRVVKPPPGGKVTPPPVTPPPGDKKTPPTPPTPPKNDDPFGNSRH
jgi:serine/threonine-protein kinase